MLNIQQLMKEILVGKLECQITLQVVENGVIVLNIYHMSGNYLIKVLILKERVGYINMLIITLTKMVAIEKVFLLESILSSGLHMKICMDFVLLLLKNYAVRLPMVGAD